MKDLLTTVGGIFILLALQIYSLTPIAGAFCVIGGIIGFATGSPFALRAVLVGVCLLAVKPVVGALFMRLLDKPRHP